MNSVIYENKIKVLIYGAGLEFENADCDFKTTFTREDEPNECTLKIYNLTDEHMYNILHNTQGVEIFTNQYGNKDSNGSLTWQSAFTGIIKVAEQKKTKTSNTSKKRKRKSNAKNKPKIHKEIYRDDFIQIDDDDADVYIELQLQEGTGSDIGTFASKSYRTGFSVKKILTDLAKSIDMSIYFDKNVKDFRVTYPIILHDNVRNSLSQVASYINCKCIIENNKVHIISNNPKGVALYYQFDESNIPKPKLLQENKIEFVAPYMPAINVGNFVRVINNTLNIDGVYEVYKREDSFSNYNEDCESKFTVKY